MPASWSTCMGCTIPHTTRPRLRRGFSWAPLATKSPLRRGGSPWCEVGMECFHGLFYRGRSPAAVRLNNWLQRTGTVPVSWRRLVRVRSGFAPRRGNKVTPLRASGKAPPSAGLFFAQAASNSRLSRTLRSRAAGVALHLFIEGDHHALGPAIGPVVELDLGRSRRRGHLNRTRHAATNGSSN